MLLKQKLLAEMFVCVCHYLMTLVWKIKEKKNSRILTHQDKAWSLQFYHTCLDDLNTRFDKYNMFKIYIVFFCSFYFCNIHKILNLRNCLLKQIFCTAKMYNFLSWNYCSYSCMYIVVVYVIESMIMFTFNYAESQYITQSQCSM